MTPFNVGCGFLLVITTLFRCTEYSAVAEPLHPDPSNPDYVSSEELKRRCIHRADLPFEVPAAQYIRSWSQYKPYLYQSAYLNDAARATVDGISINCALVVLINGRDLAQDGDWHWTWTWPWHFLKTALEETGEVKKVVLLTPQPKKMTSSIYRQTMDIADLVTEALARNTIQVEGVGHSVGVASPHDESQPLDLKGASLLLGCSRVQVHFHAACHGSIALRSLLSADRRVWDTKGNDEREAAKAVAKLQRFLRAPLFEWKSATFLVPVLAGAREQPRLDRLPKQKGWKLSVGASLIGSATRLGVPIDRIMFLDRVLPVYRHIDRARLLCSLAAAETQAPLNFEKGEGSMLMYFSHVAVFGTLDDDILVSPRSAVGVSDEFQQSLAAQEFRASVKLYKRNLLSKGYKGKGSSHVSENLKPRELSVCHAPLNRKANEAYLTQDISELLLDRGICQRPRGANRGNVLFETTLKLTQLWENPLLSSAHRKSDPTALKESLLPERGSCRRFVSILPAPEEITQVTNTPHYLAFCSRSWMLGVASPLLSAVAAAAVGGALESLTVAETPELWWI